MIRYLCLLFCWLLLGLSYANSETSEPLVEKLTLASQEMKVVSSDGIVFTRAAHANKDAIVHISIKPISVDALPEYMLTSFSSYSIHYYHAPLHPLRLYDIATEVEGSTLGLDYHHDFLRVTFPLTAVEQARGSVMAAAYYSRDLMSPYIGNQPTGREDIAYSRYYIHNFPIYYAWDLREIKIGFAYQRYFAVVNRQELMPIRHEVLSLIPHQPVKTLDGIELLWQPDETITVDEVAHVEMSEISTTMLPLRALDAFSSERWGDQKMHAERLYEMVIRSNTGIEVEDFLPYLHMNVPDMAQFARAHEDTQDYFVAIYHHNYAHEPRAACRTDETFSEAIPDCHDFDLWFLYGGEGRMDNAQLIYEAPYYYPEGLLDENGDTYYEYTYYLGVFTLVARETFFAEGEDCTLDIELITKHTSDMRSEMMWFDSQIIMTNTGTESLYWNITFDLPSNVQVSELHPSEDAYVVALHEDSQANRISIKPVYSALYRWDVGLAPKETRRVLLTGQYQGEAFSLQNFSCVSLGAPLPAGAFPPPPAPPVPVVRDTLMYAPIGASEPEPADNP